MAIKRKPHHDLIAVKAKFARVETLEATRAAIVSARALGYSLGDIVEAVQALEPADFVKSETAHTPPNSKYGMTRTIYLGTISGYISSSQAKR
jgi:motility quorum-sensing regulator/GCU-specific mRNA interferase toxin